MEVPIAKDIELDRDEETLRTWNELAQMYNDRFMTMTMYNESYDAFLTKLPTNVCQLEILDIGCGPGVVAKYFVTSPSVTTKLRVTGIDAAPNMIAFAKQNFPNDDHRWLVMDTRNLLIDKSLIVSQDDSVTNSSYFHGVVIGFCIPYLSDSAVIKLLSDCFTLMSDEGVLYISFVPGSPDKSDFKSNKSGQRVYFHYHEEERIAELLTNAGFSDIQRYYADFPRPENQVEVHCMMIARKAV